MQNTSCEMLCWMNLKLESRFPGKISMTSDIHQMTPPYGRKRRGTKESLDESERGEWKTDLKLTFKKLIMASSPISLWQIDGETVETVSDLFGGGFKITADSYCSHEIKRCLFLGRKVMTNLDSILKSRDITLLTKVRLVKVMVFPVWMWELDCEESWAPKN